MVLSAPRNVWEKVRDQGEVKPLVKVTKGNVPDLAESIHGLKAVRCHYIDVCQCEVSPTYSKSNTLLLIWIS